jgi:hypothetical protein
MAPNSEGDTARPRLRIGGATPSIAQPLGSAGTPSACHDMRAAAHCCRLRVGTRRCGAQPETLFALLSPVSGETAIRKSKRAANFAAVAVAMPVPEAGDCMVRPAYWSNRCSVVTIAVAGRVHDRAFDAQAIAWTVARYFTIDRVVPSRKLSTKIDFPVVDSTFLAKAIAHRVNGCKPCFIASRVCCCVSACFVLECAGLVLGCTSSILPPWLCPSHPAANRSP